MFEYFESLLCVPKFRIFPFFTTPSPFMTVLFPRRPKHAPPLPKPNVFSHACFSCVARGSHLCFHSSVLGFTSQRVLPLLTVASVSHAPSVLGMDLVTLVDRGGETHSFGITAVEAGFPQRFHDLLKQCLVLCKVL